jgi:hypothetical protein
MDNESQGIQRKSNPSTYQITIKGVLTENYTDWFNGMLVDFDNKGDPNPHTILTCQVRDQSELNGILNWLHNMNLTLLEVTAVEG